MSIQDMRITNEEVSPGTVPQWLLEHLISQLSDAKPYSDGGMSRILVIYPTTESRREIIELISKLHNTVLCIEGFKAKLGKMIRAIPLIYLLLRKFQPRF